MGNDDNDCGIALRAALVNALTYNTLQLCSDTNVLQLFPSWNYDTSLALDVLSVGIHIHSSRCSCDGPSSARSSCIAFNSRIQSPIHIC